MENNQEYVAKWVYEEFINPHCVNVVMFKVDKQTEAVILTRVQKYVCRIFKIKPEIKYNYTLEVEIDKANIIKVNNIVITADNNRWLVVADYGVRLKMVNTEPTVMNRILGKMFRISSVYSY